MTTHSSFIRRSAIVVLPMALLNSCQSLRSTSSTHHHPPVEPGRARLEQIESKEEPALDLKPMRVAYRFGVPIPCQQTKMRQEIQLAQWEQHQSQSGKHGSASSEIPKIEVTTSPPVPTHVSRPQEILTHSFPEVVQTGQDCLPNPTQLKANVFAEPSPLKLEVESLQQKLGEMAMMIQRLETSLAASNQQIDRLKSEVDDGQREMTFLRQTMQQQHAADLLILTQVSEKLGELITAGRAESPLLEPLADQHRVESVRKGVEPAAPAVRQSPVRSSVDTIR